MKISSIIVLAALTAPSVSAFTVIRPNAATVSSIHSRNISPLRALYFAEEETEEKAKESGESSSKAESKLEQKKSDDDKTPKKEESESESNEIESMAGSKTSDFESMSGTIYDKLGFKEDQIAIGIDPDAVLEYIGTRDDIIARFQKDNEGLDEERAAKEADKFMMDSEMVNMLIAYEDKKARGELVPDGPQFDWFTILVGGYLTFVIGSTIKRAMDRKAAVIDGDVDIDGSVQVVPDAASVQDAVNAVQGAVDLAQNTILDSVQSTVPDSIQNTIDIASSSM
mmetsp:Transcript_27264/g.41025  ORF Transcript_27264/g.41025 Transcript_27264/m.41025 type:complete len:283 (+) Transcript_27264:52-900(+)